MPGRALVAGCGRRPVHPAPDSLDAGDTHQSTHLVTPETHAGTAGGMPHLPHPVHAPILAVQIHDVIHQISLLQFGRADRAGQPPIVGLRGDLHVVLGQHGTDRLDPETVPVRGCSSSFT